MARVGLLTELAGIGGPPRARARGVQLTSTLPDSADLSERRVARARPSAPCQCCGIWPSIVDDPIARRARPAPGAAAASSSIAPTVRAPSSPQTGIGQQQFHEKKWRRRPAGGAPPRRLNQMARVGLLTELAGIGGPPRARARGVQLTSTLPDSADLSERRVARARPSAPCQCCGIWPSIVDDPIARRARPAPGAAAASSSIAPTVRAPSSPQTGIGQQQFHEKEMATAASRRRPAQAAQPDGAGRSADRTRWNWRAASRARERRAINVNAARFR